MTHRRRRARCQGRQIGREVTALVGSARHAALWLPASLALAGFAIPGCSSNPGNLKIVGKPTLEEYRGASTSLEMSRLLGHTPRRCMPNRPNSELCSWLVSSKNINRKMLSADLRTRRALNVLCPVAAATDALDSNECRIYARESRDFDADRTESDYGLAEGMAPSAKGDSKRERERNQALRVLASRTTMTALSDLVGQVPTSCEPTSSESQRCVWRFGNQALGHEIFGVIAGTKKRVDLTCALPLDGSPRAPQSCKATEKGS